MMTGIKKLFIDTSVFIYLLEDHPLYSSKIINLFDYCQKHHIELTTSSISFMEFCVKPYEQNKTEVIEHFKELLIDMDITLYTVNIEIAEIAAKLRAEYKLKSMDALQIAVKKYSESDRIVNNDKELSGKLKDECLLIADWINT